MQCDSDCIFFVIFNLTIFFGHRPNRNFKIACFDLNMAAILDKVKLHF